MSNYLENIVFKCQNIEIITMVKFWELGQFSMVLKICTPFDFFHLHNDLGLGIVIVIFCMREM
jgi:hypothetical protein